MRHKNHAEQSTYLCIDSCKDYTLLIVALDTVGTVSKIPVQSDYLTDDKWN